MFHKYHETATMFVVFYNKVQYMFRCKQKFRKMSPNSSICFKKNMTVMDHIIVKNISLKCSAKKMKPDSSKCAKSRTHHEQKTPQASQDFSSLQCEILLYCCIVDNPVGMNNYACKLIIASFSPGFARDWLWQPATNGVKSHREVDVEA